MRGLAAHFRLTLLLNLKSRQALIYGYLVPIFFLIAFGSIFRSGKPPLLGQLGQLLTISVLGGACFGMPTGMVAERERGIWRRYRLLPASTGSLVLSTMTARYVIVLSAAVMQIILAWLMYGMPLPHFPLQLTLAFTAVTFAFLGMGLIIAMLADNVPAVQALGQAIFLPMIMIGGVGVPLIALPRWAQHFAAFLPGKYAVHALDAAVTGTLGSAGFDLFALLVIGVAACVAGSRIFRWDAQERTAPRQRIWIILALAAWISAGLAAEATGRISQAPTTQITPANEAFESITQRQIDAVSYDNLPDDSSATTPVAPDFADLDSAGKARVDELRRLIATWPPAATPSPTERVRNLLNATAVADLDRDQYEGQFALLVFEKLQADVPKPDLEKILTWLILHPSPSPPAKLIVTLPELQIPDEAAPEEIPERIQIYAKKLLGRLTNKRPAQKM